MNLYNSHHGFSIALPVVAPDDDLYDPSCRNRIEPTTTTTRGHHTLALDYYLFIPVWNRWHKFISWFHLLGEHNSWIHCETQMAPDTVGPKFDWLDGFDILLCTFSLSSSKLSHRELNDIGQDQILQDSCLGYKFCEHLLTRQWLGAWFSVKSAGSDYLDLEHTSAAAQTELYIAQIGWYKCLPRRYLTDTNALDKVWPRIWRQLGRCAPTLYFLVSIPFWPWNSNVLVK